MSAQGVYKYGTIYILYKVYYMYTYILLYAYMVYGIPYIYIPVPGKNGAREKMAPVIKNGIEILSYICNLIERLHYKCDNF